MQASKLGVEVPQMGEIAAALAALQWTSRVSAALAALPKGPSGSHAPSQASPAPTPPATQAPPEPSLIAQEALDSCPCAALEDPFADCDTLLGSSPSGSCSSAADSQNSGQSTPGHCGRDCQRSSPQAAGVCLSLADAEGLVEEGRALPVDRALLEQLTAAVRHAQQWEACLVGLIGPNKVPPRSGL